VVRCARAARACCERRGGRVERETVR
jgi:hypothetical protein